MMARDIEDALVELYGATISHNVISQVIEAALDKARVWQNRPLEAIYPIRRLDGEGVSEQASDQQRLNYPIALSLISKAIN